MNCLHIFTIGLLICFAVPSIICYNILGIFPAFSKSHSILGISLMEGLANDGHNVTVITPFPKSKSIKNLRYISLENDLQLAPQMISSMVAYQKQNVWLRYLSFFDMLLWQTNTTLNNPNVQQLLKDPNEQFDVVVWAIVLNDALLGIANHFKAPAIGFSLLPTTKWSNDLVGNPTPHSYVPHVFLPLTERMTFCERVYNMLFNMWETYLYHTYHMPGQNGIYNKHFPDAKSSLEELRKNVSLVLVNSHHSIQYPRPYVPNMIEIGGINVNRQDDQLPDEIQELLDNATEGAIYFSLGTNIKFDTIDERIRNDVLSVLAKLKQTVIWKLDIVIPNKPKNVYINKWFPQNAILAHPNIRAFITHGGLLSLTEANYFGVPVVGIPFIGDQELNMKQAEQKGYAITVPLSSLNAESFHDALTKILEDERYTFVAKEVSRRFRDQPMSPLKTAIYWIKYVIRHQGAPHLRSAGQDLNWWQYYSLDVFAFLMGIVIFVLFITKKIFVLCFRMIRTLFSGNKVKVS